MAKSTKNSTWSMPKHQNAEAHGPSTRPLTSFDQKLNNPSEIEYIIREYEQQSVAAEAQKAKTAFAIQITFELYQCAAISADQLVSFLNDLDDTAEYGSELEEARVQIRRNLLTSFADHIDKLLKLGVRNIALEAASQFTTDYPVIIDAPKAAPVPQKKGIIARILGV